MIKVIDFEEMSARLRKRAVDDAADDFMRVYRSDIVSIVDATGWTHDEAATTLYRALQGARPGTSVLSFAGRHGEGVVQGVLTPPGTFELAEVWVKPCKAVPWTLDMPATPRRKVVARSHAASVVGITTRGRGRA